MVTSNTAAKTWMKLIFLSTRHTANILLISGSYCYDGYVLGSWFFAKGMPPSPISCVFDFETLITPLMNLRSPLSRSVSWISGFERIALRHFPRVEHVDVHRTRDYLIAVITFLCVGISAVFEISASLDRQQLLGGLAWIFLLGLLLGEARETKVQVAIAVIFATVGEHFASIYMGGYTYRFENVPAYVPPGHGMVYLTAVALARSGLFMRHPRKIALFVIGVWGTWSLWGISGYPDRGDAVGALLFGIFLVWLCIGRSPMVYMAAFFITTWLELLGTAVGAWHWAAIDPLLGWPQGNPPSGVGAWYCLVDAVAIGGAGPTLRAGQRLYGRFRFGVA